MFPAPPRPLECITLPGSRERERDPDMLPAPPRPEECYIFRTELVMRAWLRRVEECLRRWWPLRVRGRAWPGTRPLLRLRRWAGCPSRAHRGTVSVCYRRPRVRRNRSGCMSIDERMEGGNTDSIGVNRRLAATRLGKIVGTVGGAGIPR